MKRKKAGKKQTKKVKKPSSWQVSKSVHPGQVIQEKFLTPMKMTQAELTDKLGWKLTRLNKLINGKGGVTASSALDLSRALRTKPEFWLNLQVEYDLIRAKESDRQHR
jgi:antitoxin HigA-1